MKQPRTSARWRRLITYIRSRWGVRTLSQLLRSVDLKEEDLSGTNLMGADLSGANLIEADLSGANLKGANLAGANLKGANLAGVNLKGANLKGANLKGANLIWTNLMDADFSNVRMNWQSHELVAERLRQAAGDDPLKRMAAGFVIVSRMWCWEQFIENAPDIPLTDGGTVLNWAMSEMRTWVLENETPPSHLSTQAAIQHAARQPGN